MKGVINISFLKENSYSSVKMFLTQIVMSFFGTMLAISTLSNPSLLLWSSIFSILFYLAIIYTIGWDIGARDKLKIDGGRMRPAPEKGFLIALLANAPNLLLALLMGLGYLIDTKGSQSMSAICNAIARLINGAYLGVISTLEDMIVLQDGVGLMSYIWWWFIVMTLPSIIVGGVSYLMGSHDIRIIPQKVKQDETKRPNMADHDRRKK